jgi:hypothetical protein
MKRLLIAAILALIAPLVLSQTPKDDVQQLTPRFCPGRPPALPEIKASCPEDAGQTRK